MLPRAKFCCPKFKASERLVVSVGLVNETDRNRKEPINELSKSIAAYTSMDGERNLFIKNY